jgi:hypothetical protein
MHTKNYNLKMTSYYNKTKMTDQKDNKNQKNRICVIYIGAASHSPTSGQLTNIRHESAMGVQFISVDPEHSHKKENIEQRCGIPANYMTETVNLTSSSSINIFASTAEEFFTKFRHDQSTFYLVLTFIGYDMEYTSFQIAEYINIKNQYFYNTKNALFLGMSCLAKPPNVFQILRNYGINPQIIPFVANIDQSKHNVYYAMLQSIDILTTHYHQNEVRDWHAISLTNLRKIGILSYEDACKYYNNLPTKTIHDARMALHDYLESNNMLKIFKDERENDFH